MIGLVALWGAVAVCFLSLISRKPRRFLRLAVFFAVASTVALTYALVTNDFALEYVSRTTSRATPWAFRVAALWGGMEGSLLFYATLSLGVGLWGSKRRGRVEHFVVAANGLGLLLLTAITSNPFRVLDIPAVDGQGLLAILQHPAMVYHPPILYLGLTILVVPFALTLRGAVTRKLGNRWVADTRRWLMISWTLLTVGMVAGANWAYVELGWGGFWAWDPVENTALMSWLAATVFLHISRVLERDGRLARSTAFFAMFPFALSVLGVYLTRSGVTGSIHSFAEDPVVGRTLLISALGAAAVVVVFTIRSWPGKRWEAFGTGRDSWLLASGVLTGLALMFVLVGSAFPAYAQVFAGDTVGVDSRFFVTTVLPVALAISLLIAFALETTWNRARLRPADGAVYAGTAVGALVLSIVFAQQTPIGGMALAALAAGALGTLVVQTARRRRWLAPARLAHLGLALVLVGAGGSSLGDEHLGPMSIGESVQVGTRTVELVSISTGEADRYIYVEGVFLIDGHSEMRPQIRAYEGQRLPVAEPALRSTPVSDLILAVSVVSPDLDGFEVSVFVRPMVWWVWVGALVISMAGVAALVSKRGGGGERRRAATTTRPPTGTTNGMTGR